MIESTLGPSKPPGTEHREHKSLVAASCQGNLGGQHVGEVVLRLRSEVILHRQSELTTAYDKAEGDERRARVAPAKCVAKRTGRSGPGSSRCAPLQDNGGAPISVPMPRPEHLSCCGRGGALTKGVRVHGAERQQRRGKHGVEPRVDLAALHLRPNNNTSRRSAPAACQIDPRGHPTGQRRVRIWRSSCRSGPPARYCTWRTSPPSGQPAARATHFVSARMWRVSGGGGGGGQTASTATAAAERKRPHGREIPPPHARGCATRGECAVPHCSHP